MKFFSLIAAKVLTYFSERKLYRLKATSLGQTAAGVNMNKALALADELEDEAIIQKMWLGK